MLARFAHRSAVVAVAALAVWVSGCASTAATRCLRLPVSSKLPAAAVKRCERALADHPARLDLFQHTMALLREKGDLPAIERWSREMLGRDPARSDAQFNLAFSLRQQGRYQEALAAYQAYARAKPDDPDPLFGIALCHEGLGAAAAAINAYDAYLAREQRPARRPWRQRAQQRRQALLGHPSAGHPLRPAGAVAPARPGPTTSARAPAAATGASAAPRAAPPSTTNRPPAPAVRPNPAPRDCRPLKKAIAADPFATTAYERFAVCARQGGKHREIVRHMRIALRDNPEWARGWLHLGRAQQALGKTAQAKASLAKACAAGVAEAC